jgi:uncharacterized membrane protein YfcA
MVAGINYTMEWGYLLAGLFVGIMVGMTGVGGGSLMTPMLIFGFAVQPAVAVGTDLLFAAITKAGGVWAYWQHGLVNWLVVKRLAMGSITTTILTLWLLTSTGVGEGEHNELITFALGLALILTSSALLLKSSLGSIMKAQADHPLISVLHGIRQGEKHKMLATVITGGFLGVMVTLSSVGAGALGAVILLFLYPKMKGIEIVATDIAHAVPLTAIAGLGHASANTVDWSLLSYLVMGSLPGIYIGSHVGVKIPDQIMRYILAVILFGVGVKCLV